MSWRRMDSLKLQSQNIVARPSMVAIVESKKKGRSKSYSQRQLDSIERREDILIDGIKKLPRAPPQLGLIGQGINLIREFPELFVEATTWSFGNKGLYLLTTKFEEALTN